MDSSRGDSHPGHRQANGSGGPNLELELLHYADTLRALCEDKGSDSPDVYAFRNNFASLMAEKGYIAVAVGLLEELVRDLGNYDVDIESQLVTRANLARLYELQGNSQSAAEEYAALYRDCLQHYGREHYVTQNAKTRLDKYAT